MVDHLRYVLLSDRNCADLRLLLDRTRELRPRWFEEGMSVIPYNGKFVAC